jgi:endoglucanase
MSICWGATDFGKGKPDMLNFSKKSSLTHCEGYDMANQTAYLDSMLRWGLDWLIKVARPSSSGDF